MATDSSLMEISPTLIAKNEKKEKLIELILSRVMLAKARVETQHVRSLPKPHTLHRHMYPGRQTSPSGGEQPRFVKFSFAHCFHANGSHAKLPESSDKPLY